MVIVKLNGGIGNQLFQFAFGKNIASQNKIKLKFDTTPFSADIDRSFKLKFFNIDHGIADNTDLTYFTKNNTFIKRFFNFFEIAKPFRYKRYYKENGFKFNKNTKKLKSKNLYLEGYWQSEKYFKDISEIIKKEITLKDGLDKKFDDLVEKIKNNVSVSIHFRKSDYLLEKHSSIYSNLDNNYYQKAIEIINKTTKNPLFFIFSDDVNWVKNNIKLPSTSVFVSNGKNKDYEELILMSKCKNNIIANSTFSWWGAWLNKNSYKTVIAPKNWFKDKNTNTEDLIPNNWIKI